MNSKVVAQALKFIIQNLSFIIILTLAKWNSVLLCSREGSFLFEVFPRKKRLREAEKLMSFRSKEYLPDTQFQFAFELFHLSVAKIY